MLIMSTLILIERKKKCLYIFCQCVCVYTHIDIFKMSRNPSYKILILHLLLVIKCYVVVLFDKQFLVFRMNDAIINLELYSHLIKFWSDSEKLWVSR